MRTPSDRLVLTCEHAGHRIPREYAPLFRSAKHLLQSHRGWDPGALAAARLLARRFRVRLRSVTWSRLLVDANRSPSNPRIWSRHTAGLSREERHSILRNYWWPHRNKVHRAIGTLVAGRRRVVHVAVHSFVPVMAGQRRNADIGLLYDPQRSGERVFCTRWKEILEEMAPGLRVRRNYPYRGATDGLATWLRRRFSERRYLGVELEINQLLLSGSRRSSIQHLVAQSLDALLRS